MVETNAMLLPIAVAVALCENLDVSVNEIDAIDDAEEILKCFYDSDVGSST